MWMYIYLKKTCNLGGINYLSLFTGFHKCYTEFYRWLAGFLNHQRPTTPIRWESPRHSPFLPVAAIKLWHPGRLQQVFADSFMAGWRKHKSLGEIPSKTNSEVYSFLFTLRVLEEYLQSNHHHNFWSLLWLLWLHLDMNISYKSCGILDLPDASLILAQPKKHIGWFSRKAGFMWPRLSWTPHRCSYKGWRWKFPDDEKTDVAELPAVYLPSLKLTATASTWKWWVFQ